MKRILITGKNSYVGTNFRQWLAQWPDQYQVDAISVRDDSWRQHDFSQYDVVLHVAAIVHRKEKRSMKQMYYEINRDLAIDVANKAKQSGVKQFIFMSSMSVYGLEGKIGEEVIITKDTPCEPTTYYGMSKLEAEKELLKIAEDHFKLAIIRPPMIYGPNCPGNYTRLRKYILRIPIFPLINNQRSMIFIENLNEFIRFLINTQRQGMYFPQNRDYVSVVELVTTIAKVNNKKIWISAFLAKIIELFLSEVSLIQKLFGNLTYDMNITKIDNIYLLDMYVIETVNENN